MKIISLQKTKDEDNFFDNFFKWHLPIFKAKKAWIHIRKVIDSLCYSSCIVPLCRITFCILLCCNAIIINDKRQAVTLYYTLL